MIFLLIFENYYGKDHYHVASALVNLANSYFSLGKSQKRQELLERALIIQEKHYGE